MLTSRFLCLLLLPQFGLFSITGVSHTCTHVLPHTVCSTGFTDFDVMVHLTPEERAYAAGLMDGDGCACAKDAGSIVVSICQATPFAVDREHVIVPPMLTFLQQAFKGGTWDVRPGPWRKQGDAETRDWITESQVQNLESSDRLGRRDRIDLRWNGPLAKSVLRVMRDHCVLKYQQASECLDLLNGTCDDRAATVASIKSTKGAKLEMQAIRDDRINIYWLAGFFDAEGHVAMYRHVESVKGQERKLSRFEYRIVLTPKNTQLLELIRDRLMPGALLKQGTKLRYYRAPEQMMHFAEALLKTNLLRHKQAQLNILHNWMCHLRYEARRIPVPTDERIFQDNCIYEMQRLKHDRCFTEAEAEERIAVGDFDNFFMLGPLVRPLSSFKRIYDPYDVETHPRTACGTYSRWMLFGSIPGAYRRVVFSHKLHSSECLHCGPSRRPSKTAECHNQHSASCCIRHGCFKQPRTDIAICHAAMQQIQNEQAVAAKATLLEFVDVHLGPFVETTEKENAMDTSTSN
jgi:hypothetical protein